MRALIETVSTGLPKRLLYRKAERKTISFAKKSRLAKDAHLFKII